MRPFDFWAAASNRHHRHVSRSCMNSNIHYPSATGVSTIDASGLEIISIPEDPPRLAQLFDDDNIDVTCAALETGFGPGPRSGQSGRCRRCPARKRRPRSGHTHQPTSTHAWRWLAGLAFRPTNATIVGPICEVAPRPHIACHKQRRVGDRGQRRGRANEHGSNERSYQERLTSRCRAR